MRNYFLLWCRIQGVVTKQKSKDLRKWSSLLNLRSHWITIRFIRICFIPFYVCVCAFGYNKAQQSISVSRLNKGVGVFRSRPQGGRQESRKRTLEMNPTGIINFTNDLLMKMGDENNAVYSSKNTKEMRGNKTRRKYGRKRSEGKVT